MQLLRNKKRLVPRVYTLNTLFISGRGWNPAVFKHFII